MKRVFIMTTVALVSCSVLLTGCSSEEMDYSASPETTAMQSPTDEAEQQVFDAALAEAIFLINSVDKTRSQRSVPTRDKLCLQSLRARSGSRSASTDNVQGDIYAVNFGDDEGFSIIGTIRGVPNVYAYSSSGSFTFDPTQNCDGVNTYVEWLEHEMDTYYRWPNDTAIPDLPNPPKPPVPWPGDPVLPSTTEVVPPILPYKVRIWNQGIPFSKYTPEFGSLNAHTGCTAVACAQVMAAFQWPKSYDGVQYDWEAMRAGDNDDLVAMLMFQLGYPKNLDMTYRDPLGKDGSEADAANIPRTFKNFGYEKPTLERKYDSEKVIKCLREGHPVLVGGTNELGTHKGIGHAWVIDGLMQYSYNDLGLNPEPGFPGIIKFYHHCVWGWGTENMGWFLITPPSTDTGSVGFNPYSTYNSYAEYSAMNWITDIRIKTN